MWIKDRLRKPLLGPVGQPLTAALCAYEAIALLPWVPLPTISEIVWRHPEAGLVLLGLLGHHWFIEKPEGWPQWDYPPLAEVMPGD